jgi:hypothetical protein
MQMILLLTVLALGFGVEFFTGPQRITYPTAYDSAREAAVARHFLDFQRALDRYVAADPRTRLAQLAATGSTQAGGNDESGGSATGAIGILQNAGLLPSNFTTVPMFGAGGPPWGVAVGPAPPGGVGQRVLYIHTGAPAALPPRINPPGFAHHVRQGLEGGMGSGIAQGGRIIAFGAQGTTTDAQLQQASAYEGHDRNAVAGQAVQIAVPGVPDGAVVLVRAFSVSN